MDSEALREIGHALREGGRTRVNHGCGEGKTMLVSREGSRVRGWCFRCNEGMGSELHLSLRDNLFRVQQAQRIAADAEFRDSEEQPPTDPDMARWPAVARLWLLQAGMAEAAAHHFGIGWSEDMQRLVLPLRDIDRKDRSWTARAFDGRLPKYLTGTLPEGFVTEARALSHIKTIPPVVTEDWLSALKLSMHGIHAVSMLGTYPKPATLMRLIELQEVIVWLDNDLPPKHRINYGQMHAATLGKTLRAYGVKVHNVVSDREPKEMSGLDIMSTLAPFAMAHIPSVNAHDGESVDG